LFLFFLEKKLQTLKTRGIVLDFVVVALVWLVFSLELEPFNPQPKAFLRVCDDLNMKCSPQLMCGALGPQLVALFEKVETLGGRV
jgi:hypothetical protein